MSVLDGLFIETLDESVAGFLAELVNCEIAISRPFCLVIFFRVISRVFAEFYAEFLAECFLAVSLISR